MTLTASHAFMLPVSTPCNAIIYTAAQRQGLTIRHMAGVSTVQYSTVQLMMLLLGGRGTEPVVPGDHCAVSALLGGARLQPGHCASLGQCHHHGDCLTLYQLTTRTISVNG